jgi:shikimate kinase/3-dehydroquinate dehydratase
VEVPKFLPRTASFEPSVSIVLIGVRGVGKSTLGILAATAYSRRLIDTDRAFQEAAGSTASEFRKSKGTAEYRKRHGQVFESTLKSNSSGAVIVCNFSDLEGNGARILRDYAQSHPVIHITRDVEGVKSLLRIWTTERVNELLVASNPLLRSCSNYEFYNLTESQHGQEHHKDIDRNGSVAANENFLTLKRVERDFLKLLQNIVGDFERAQSHHSAYPFSQVEVERRKYTFAVTIATSQVLEETIDFDNAQIGADCVELSVNHKSTSKRRYFSDIAKAFATVRRATILPIMLSVEKVQSSAIYASMFEICDFCLRLGPELCVVNLSLTDSQLLSITRSKGNSRIVGQLEMSSSSQQGWNDQACTDAYSRAAGIGCDIVKITMPALSVDDVFDTQALQRQVKALKLRPPLIAYSTGSKGRTSKCFNKTLTSVRPEYTLSGELTDATRNTDVSAQDISQALFGSFVFEPLRFFIYGADVSYSLSPAMHNVAYDACGMRYTYEAMSSDSIDELKKLVRMNDFGGTAITQPYKTSALELMDGLSPHAKAIGAVNTIVPIRKLSADGRIPDEIDIISRRTQQGPVKALYGFNTGIVLVTIGVYA